jgi:hypothetical protein
MNPKTDILCHSTFCLFCLVALSNHSSLVATLKLHTNLLFPIDFNSGSPPKLPTNKDSKIVGCVPFPRTERHGNIFHKKSQAEAMVAVAKLTQQLADFNDGWEPEWGRNNTNKYCIYRKCC